MNTSRLKDGIWAGLLNARIPRASDVMLKLEIHIRNQLAQVFTAAIVMAETEAERATLARLWKQITGRDLRHVLDQTKGRVAV